MVATGQADIAALDAVSWAHTQRFGAFAQGLKVIGWTAPPTPGLTFITAKGNNARLLRAALDAGIETLPPKDKKAIGIQGIVDTPTQDYLAVNNPDFDAQIVLRLKIFSPAVILPGENECACIKQRKLSAEFT